MKTALTAATGVLVLAVVGAVATAGTSTHGSQIRLATNLTPQEEVPAPRGEVAAARGTFAATATKTATGADIAWRLTFTGLTTRAVAAHIHSPAARGVAAPVTVPLCAPCEPDVSGTATLTPVVLQAIQNGQAYVNVHTQTNAPGEIRGQLGITASVTAGLNTRQEVPRPRRTRAGARATFTGAVTKDDRGSSLSWRLTFSRLTGRAIAAHIHIARRGRPGPVAVSLCGPCRSGQSGTAQLGDAVLTALDQGRAYVNVHTRRNPAGEVRGQLPAASLTLATTATTNANSGGSGGGSYGGDGG